MRVRVKQAGQGGLAGQRGRGKPDQPDSDARLPRKRSGRRRQIQFAMIAMISA